MPPPDDPMRAFREMEVERARKEGRTDAQLERLHADMGDLRDMMRGMSQQLTELMVRVGARDAPQPPAPASQTHSTGEILTRMGLVFSATAGLSLGLGIVGYVAFGGQFAGFLGG